MGRRHQSIQQELLQKALSGEHNNRTITAYKTDIKLFAKYCRQNGVNDPGKLEGDVGREMLQQYEKSLETAKYSPSTIHRRLAAPCKGLGVSMAEIDKPRRSGAAITRSRDQEANSQGKAEVEQAKNNRLVAFQRAVGIRRAELEKLTGNDLMQDESGKMCVRVRSGKGGKEQLQRILPHNQKVVQDTFAGIAPDEKLFARKDMANHIDLHGMRRQAAREAYAYYNTRLRQQPYYREKCLRELLARYNKYNHGDVTKWIATWYKDDTPYKLRGDNRRRALDQRRPVEYDRVALMMVSVFHLSHWRLDVTVTNYML